RRAQRGRSTGEAVGRPPQEMRVAGVGERKGRTMSGMSPPRILVSVAIVLAGVAALLIPAPGWGHAALVKSIPARRAARVKAPDRVQLWFNERLEPAFATLSVWDGKGQQVDTGDAVVAPDDPKRLTIGLKPLGAGAYTVKFRVLSVDGHVVESEFGFRLRPAQRGGPGPPSPRTPPPPWPPPPSPPPP